MTVATQRERVLNALHSNRHRGVAQPDFLGPDTIDGAKPITRLAARIEELRDEGVSIEVVGRRNRCAVYRLVDGEGGDAPQGFSSPGPGRVIPLAAGIPLRWFCHWTRGCIRAGALDSETCPRGADHKTHREHYLDYRLARQDDERLAA